MNHEKKKLAGTALLASILSIGTVNYTGIGPESGNVTVEDNLTLEQYKAYQLALQINETETRLNNLYSRYGENKSNYTNYQAYDVNKTREKLERLRKEYHGVTDRNLTIESS